MIRCTASQGGGVNTHQLPDICHGFPTAVQRIAKAERECLLPEASLLPSAKTARRRAVCASTREFVEYFLDKEIQK